MSCQFVCNQSNPTFCLCIFIFYSMSIIRSVTHHLKKMRVNGNSYQYGKSKPRFCFIPNMEMSTKWTKSTCSFFSCCSISILMLLIECTCYHQFAYHIISFLLSFAVLQRIGLRDLRPSVHDGTGRRWVRLSWTNACDIYPMREKDWCRCRCIGWRCCRVQFQS